jgi:LPS export ABC transporter protein LptC
MGLENEGMKGKIPLRSLIGWVIVGSLGAVAFFVWQALAPGSGEKESPVKPDAAADLKLNRVRYTETREGQKEWELEAEAAVYYRDRETVVLEKIRGTFYGKNQESYVLVGERGRFNTQTKVIEVYDGVQIDSSLGYRVRTKSLHYRAEQRELATSDPVEIKGPDMQVEGVGMVLELNRERLRILGGVKTTLSSLDWKKSSKSAM